MQNFPKTLLGFYIKQGLKGYWASFVFWMITFFIYRAGSGFFKPLYQKWFIELLESTPTLGMNFLQLALPTVALIVGLWLFFDLTDICRHREWAKIQCQTDKQMSETLTDYINLQSTHFITTNKTGQLISYIGLISQGFSGIENVLNFIASLIAVFASFSLLVNLDSTIAITMLIGLLYRPIIYLIMTKPINDCVKNIAHSSSELSGELHDSISNFSIVKLFARTDFERKVLQGLRNKCVFYKTHIRYLYRLAWGSSCILRDLIFGLLLLLMARSFIAGQIDLSTIVFAISAYFVLSEYMVSVLDSVPETIEKFSTAKFAYHKLIKPISVKDADNAKKLKTKHGEIEIRNISFSYPDTNNEILHNLSIKIAYGEKIGIVGKSGAGKTTFVNLIMRFYDPTKGNIYINKQDISKVTQKSLREHISFIPQDSNMFNRTLAQNIGYGKVGATRTQIKNAAKLAGVDHFINSTPKGYDTVVGERGIKLSGGQRQRISIARAFLKNAPILILDEATAALDSETELIVQKSFKKLSTNRTTIAIAHRLSTLRNMDRIIVLDKGHIVEDGTHKQLLKKKGIYYKLWKMQSNGFLPT
ncbi:MAG: ABC transporter ATP-binding protein/permease [Rickettsiales bacterium]|nr:ABC transporter ATP-binding protein/permease [Rickettsiales bacterium]